MTRNSRRNVSKDSRRAFTLVELVMVITIIGVLASIAVPRMTAAAANASANSIKATLANVRKAIDIYYAEHDQYPGYNPADLTPDGIRFIMQLTGYSDFSGNVNATYSSTYQYGPYLRAPFPRNPINNLNSVHVKATPGVADPAEGSVGWVAVLSHGYFGISATNQQLTDIGEDDPVRQKKMRSRTQ